MKQLGALITFALVAVGALAWAACGDDATGPSVATIEVTPSTASVLVGGTVQLTATARDGSGNPVTVRVTWTSSTGAASVSSTGLVTGVAPGTPTITASAGGPSGSSVVTVLAPVASVEVSPPVDTVRAGETIQITATPKDADGNPLAGRTITWSSDDVSIATVDEGIVTGEGAGTATITATSEGQSGMADVTVWVGVTGSWSGIIATFDNCQLDLSITEDEAGSITGTADLYAPCGVSTFNVTGTNNTGGVTDSVSMTLTRNDGGSIEFDGTFDGDATLTGVINQAGCCDFPTTLTRQSISPAPPAQPAKRADIQSRTMAHPLLRRKPNSQ